MVKSGSHLGAMRSWIQWNARNGDRVTWGSDEFVELKPQTAKDLDELAQRISDAAVTERLSRIERNIQTLLSWTGPDKPPFNPDTAWELDCARRDLGKFLEEWRQELGKNRP